MKTAESGPVSANAAEAGFLPIHLSCLRIDTIARFDIFVQYGTLDLPVLYRTRHLPITAENISHLRDNGVGRIYVPSHQDAEYRAYIEENLKEILGDNSIPVEERSSILYDSATNLVRAVLEDPRSAQSAKRSKVMAANAAIFLSLEQHAFEHILSLVSFDYYTYTHSVNVFVFSFMLAQHAGIADAQALHDLAEGTLLHDVGKCMLDTAIIQSIGPLSDAQWEEMRKHPVYGYDILVQHGIFSDRALDIVRHHHEKLRGGGYPDGLRGDQIHLLVRISTIADVFDAMTTRRCYRNAMGSFSALQIMRDEMAGDLDTTLFRKFVDMMGNPKGVKVVGAGR